MQKYDTPMASGVHVNHPDEDVDIVSHDKITDYQSVVVALLYLTKFSCPDLANSVRELSKVMDGPSMCDIKIMLHVVKYIEDTKNWELKIEHPGKEPWTFNVFSDSDWEGYAQTR